MLHALESQEHATALFEGLDNRSIRTIPARREVLKNLLIIFKAHHSEIVQALYSDLRRHPQESLFCEVYPIVGELKHIIKKLPSWAKQEKLSRSIVLTPGKTTIQRVPLGKGLIVAPFNYPFFLTFPYVAMAIAAGNSVVVRTSQKTPASSAVICRMLAKLQRPDLCRGIQCGYDIADFLLTFPWNKVLYTGSTAVARHIAAATAGNLVPLTLELGGKSPTIVMPSANLDLAAKRVLSGKVINAGQTCVAPDYALVHRDVFEPFTQRLVAHMEAFFGGDPEASPSFPRMVTPAAAERVAGLVADAEARDGVTVVAGGSAGAKPAERYVPPTILQRVPPDAAVMREEIFGPVLPMIEIGSLTDAVEFIAARPHPLALYAFTDSAHDRERILAETISGDLVFNDVLVHTMHHDAPFGGVGHSGMGAVHGFHSFLDWSSLRTVVARPTGAGVGALENSFRYPPYKDEATKLCGTILCGWNAPHVPTPAELARRAAAAPADASDDSSPSE